MLRSISKRLDREIYRETTTDAYESLFYEHKT